MARAALTKSGPGRPDEQTLVHATAVAVGEAGVLLRGPSGSGKSDLALRLIDQGARLIADDQSLLQRRGPEVVVSAPGAIAGQMEVRGIGIVAVRPSGPTRVDLVVDLVTTDEIERMPDETDVALLGAAVRGIRLAGHESSAPAKIRLVLSNLDDKQKERR